MLLFDGVGGLVVLGLWIFCFIDVLLTPETACRNLPKLAWVFLVLLLPLVGCVAWLVVGRPWTAVQSVGRPRPGTGAGGGSGRASRYVPMNPDDDEEFLAGLRKRAEEQRRQARDQQDREGPETA